MPVEIHGKQYATVQERITQLYNDHPDASIVTQILSDADKLEIVIFKATIHIDGIRVSTGHAYEAANTSKINKTSHVENAETSAIGRALANWKYGSDGPRPSAEEMQKVQRMSQPGKKVAALLEALVGYEDKAQQGMVKKGWIRADQTADDLTEKQAQSILENNEFWDWLGR